VSSGTRSQTGPLVVELWYAEAPDLGDPRLIQGLRSQWPATELQLESIVVPHGDPPSPLLTVIMSASPLGEGGKALPDVSQTWDWAGAELAVSASRRSLLVTEMFADGKTPQQRWGAMSRVVAELARRTRPTVLSWPQSQRVIVMDTLGLHVFGLPDVQCHFRDRRPGEIAPMLFRTAVYLFQSGDVIADGNTITGPWADERLVCLHEPALLAPSRRVIDIDLGDPYAAGWRDRHKQL
jgi:Domain of unknown function (DUF4261)